MDRNTAARIAVLLGLDETLRGVDIAVAELLGRHTPKPCPFGIPSQVVELCFVARGCALTALHIYSEYYELLNNRGNEKELME